MVQPGLFEVEYFKSKGNMLRTDYGQSYNWRDWTCTDWCYLAFS